MEGGAAGGAGLDGPGGDGAARPCARGWEGEPGAGGPGSAPRGSAPGSGGGVAPPDPGGVQAPAFIAALGATALVAAGWLAEQGRPHFYRFDYRLTEGLLGVAALTALTVGVRLLGSRPRRQRREPPLSSGGLPPS